MKLSATGAATFAVAMMLALTPIQALADCDYQQEQYEQTITWIEDDKYVDENGNPVDEHGNLLPDCSHVRSMKDYLNCMNMTAAVDMSYAGLIPRDDCDMDGKPSFWQRGGTYERWLKQIRRQAGTHSKKVKRNAETRQE